MTTINKQAQQSSEPRVKLIRMVDGVPVEQEMSPVEQMLADQLVYMRQAAIKAVTRSNRRFWISVAANVVLLIVYWFALQ